MRAATRLPPRHKEQTLASLRYSELNGVEKTVLRNVSNLGEASRNDIARVLPEPGPGSAKAP